MRAVRFRDPAGATRNGEWTDSGIEFGDRLYQPDEVDVLAPVSPSKIVCLGMNYTEHAEDEDVDVPPRPILFKKSPNAVAGHEDTIELPDVDVPGELLPENFPIELGEGRIDFEAELGVVIGRQCRNVPVREASEVVAGYTCVNDVSNRDDQAIETNSFGDLVRGKSFDGSAPIGPVVASPELVPENPRVRLWIDGEKKQDSKGEEMFFSVAEAIAEITTYVTLEPEDVVAMGSPTGYGPLTDGDTVEIEVEGVGRLVHYVSGD